MGAKTTNKAFRRFGFLWAFVDFLVSFNVLMLVINLLVFMMIKPTVDESEVGVARNAEYIMTMTWDKEVDCDIDIWVRNPNGSVIYFAAKDVDQMNIERDDMGTTSDTTTVNGKQIKNDENVEYVTLRKTYEGEYLVNVHSYACHDSAGNKISVGASLIEPLTVNVQIIKINPRFNVVFDEDVVLKQVWQEETVVRFNLDKFGMFHYVDKAFERLVSTNSDVPTVTGE